MVDLLFFDTSILLPGILQPGPEESPASEIFDRLAAGHLGRPLTAWHCVLEFLSVSTRLPTPFRLTPEKALFLIREEILPRFQLAQLPEVGFDGFLEAVEKERIVGGRIYDLHIAEIARSAGARTVVTDNRRHFMNLLRYGVRVVTASELLAELGPSQP